MHRTYVILIMLLSILLSCTKEIEKLKDISGVNDQNDITSINGKITLTLEVKHHYRPIPEFTVFLKKDALQFPGEDVSVYDFSATTNQNGFVQFNNLNFGDYYLYGNGYDYEIADSIIGYKATLLDSSTVDNVGLNYEINEVLYVSEQH